jgi:hypothetical protein
MQQEMFSSMAWGNVTHQRVGFAWRRGICMCHLCGVKGGAKKHIKVGVWHVHKVYN